MQSRSRWIDDIEIRPGPNEDAQKIAWVLVASALDTSMLSEGPGKPIKTGNKAIARMAEARSWFFDTTDAVPGEYLGDGMIAGDSFKSCISVLPLSMIAAKRILGYLWLLQDTKIWDTLYKQLQASRVALRQEKKHNDGLRSNMRKNIGTLRWAAKHRHEILLGAGEVLKESRGWY